MLGALKLLVLRACACARVRVCVFICLISFYFPCPWKCRSTALRDRAVDELVTVPIYDFNWWKFS